MVKVRAITASSLILLCVVASSIVYLQPVKGQYQTITIRADGSFTPSFAPIQQKGNLYSVTDNFAGAIMMQRNNSGIDGNGHLVNGITIDQVQNVTVNGFVLTGGGGLYGIYVYDCTDVILANNTISGTDTIWEGTQRYLTGAIYVLEGNSNRIIENNLFNNYVGLLLDNTRQNTITLNNITESKSSAIEFSLSSDNLIYLNNFVNNSLPILDYGPPYQAVSLNTWNSGMVGNFWSDYKTKYPNATEVGSSGIGNIPYVIDQNNVDSFPLIKQANTNNPTPTPTLTPSIPELSWLVTLPLLLSLFSVAVVVRHRKTANLSK